MASAPCRSCGQPLRAGVRICTNCGVPVWQSDPPVTAPNPGGVATAPAQQVVEQITPPPTQPLEPISKVIRLKPRHLVALSALAALLLIGAIAAGAMTAPQEEVAGELVGQLPFDSDGGTKSFDGGKGSITVPKGALDGPQTIEVRRLPVRDRVTAGSPDGRELTFPAGALIAYVFGPVSLTFNSPVTISLVLPATGQSGLVFVTQGGEIRFFAGSIDGRTITFRLNSFDLSSSSAIVITDD